MGAQPGLDQAAAFAIRVSPDPIALGKALESNHALGGTYLQLRFGDQAAGFPIADLWSACCELLLEAQLAREEKLDHFVIDAERIFEICYSGDLLICMFSREHVFAVPKAEFAAALDHVVDQIFAGTSCPRLMRVAARWGASTLRALPYAARFTGSTLV